MAAVSDRTVKRLLWLEDKWTDFWYAMDKPAVLVAGGAWFALLALFLLTKGALFILNIESHPVLMTIGGILLGVPVLLILVAILFVIALFVVSTPLVVAGRAIWLARNTKTTKSSAENIGLGFAKAAIIMFSIVGALVGVHGMTHNLIGVEGFLTYTVIGLATGVGFGAWGLFFMSAGESADSFEESLAV